MNSSLKRVSLSVLGFLLAPIVVFTSITIMNYGVSALNASFLQFLMFIVVGLLLFSVGVTIIVASGFTIYKTVTEDN